MDIATSVFSAFSSDKYKMTHEYGAIIASLVGALLIVGAVEIVNINRSLGTERHKLDMMFADELKESAIAHRTGVPIPTPRRRKVASRTRLYFLLRKMVRLRLRALYALWTLTITLDVTLLQAIIGWAALSDGGPAPLRATLIGYGTLLAMLLTIVNAGLRIKWLWKLTVWEERVELADRMGLPPAEMRSLLRSWGRHTGHGW
ncbi:hypothetical protein SUDANB5_00043 [Streptomyces sp. SudanB5_2050]|uniref:hypothetical protein n=1 Tax=Streptomyces sp. SudanB5_2050 TaxID=3035274 RepID=UPI0036DF284D